MARSNKRQFSKMSVAYIILGIALITLMTIIGASAFMRTSEIKVEGDFSINPETIIEASGLSVGDNLLFLNPRNISQRIRKTMPFVNAAKVMRILPDTVVIEIVESSAIAVLSHMGESFIVDSTGRVLEKTDGTAEEIKLRSDHIGRLHLIEVRGIDIEDAVLGSVIKPIFGTEMKLQYMQDVLNALEREDMVNDVSYLDVSNIVNVHFGYIDKFKVILGGSINLRQSNIRYNLERLPGAIEEVEFRYPNTTGNLDLSDVNSNPKFTPN